MSLIVNLSFKIRELTLVPVDFKGVKSGELGQPLIPNICKTTNITVINQEPIRLTRTAFSTNSFYIVQGTKIWFVNDDQVDLSVWPQRLSTIFPSVDSQINAILYDNIRNEYLVFKVI